MCTCTLFFHSRKLIDKRFVAFHLVSFRFLFKGSLIFCVFRNNVAVVSEVSACVFLVDLFRILATDYDQCK